MGRFESENISAASFLFPARPSRRLSQEAAQDRNRPHQYRKHLGRRPQPQRRRRRSLPPIRRIRRRRRRRLPQNPRPNASQHSQPKARHESPLRNARVRRRQLRFHTWTRRTGRRLRQSNRPRSFHRRLHLPRRPLASPRRTRISAQQGLSLMRAVIQRVSRAKVTVNGETTGEIANGLLVLLGVATGDTNADADYLAEKIIGLRIFEDQDGKMNLSVADTAGALLVVSQFTLYGDVRRGKRPSFDAAAPPQQARELYEYFVEKIRTAEMTCETGRFQEMMQVELVNEGPVTILLDSAKAF